MNFISFAFIILVIPVLIARLTIGRNGTENSFRWLILLTSTIFVMWHIPAYISIMLISSGTDFLAAKWLHRLDDSSAKRKWILFWSMAVNLGLLAFFKYTNFALQLTEDFSGLFGHKLSLPHPEIILPMGISFYTFGSMSYTIDVYRRRMKPIGSFKDFYFFVTFFPHMVAGPIIKAENFFQQYARRRRLNSRALAEGAYLIIYGLFLKMVCADNIASYVNPHWQAGESSATVHLGLAFLFAMQIFCDFEGYSSIARGLAYWFGFRFPINFDFPYLATSFKNFWERWHITLSTWLRDYLYISLGGNRGSSLRTMFNLLIVMLLGGLWHGASLTFVVWGAIHGVALAIERAFGLHTDKARSLASKALWYVTVQFTVLIAWVFFRSTSVGEACNFCKLMVTGEIAPPPIWLINALIFTIPPVMVHLWNHLDKNRPESIRSFVRPLVTRAIACGVMLYLVATCYGNTGDFIYFQF